MEEQKKPLSKGVIAAFIVMGVVIVGLIIALIATNIGKDSPQEEQSTVSQTSDTVEEVLVPGTAADTYEEESAPEAPSAPETPPGSEEIEVMGDETAPPEGEEPNPGALEIDPAGGVPGETEEDTTAPADNPPAPNDNPVPTTTASTTKQTTKAPTDKQPTDSQNSYTVSWAADNSWDASGTTMYGMNFGITNNSKSSISGWKLVLHIEGLSVCDGWNGTYVISGDTLTITNAEYNGDIGSGGSVSVGCNLGTTKPFALTAAELNGKPCNIVSGTVPNTPNNGGGNVNNNNNDSTPNKKEMLARCEDAVQGDDWLHTDGNKIVDKDGKQVWLTGVNWFGYNTGTNIFDGLWASELKSSVKAIADHGFNLIRVPISAELLNQWAKGEYPQANYNQAYNSELNGLNSLEIFDYFLKLAEENGMKVMPDIHSAETNASGHTINLWYTSKVSYEEYASALEWLADRYKNNDTIIAIDLKNEPHGKPYEGSGAAIWNDSKQDNNWKYIAEKTALRVLAKNPNLLIMVEGTEIYSKKNGSYTSTNDDDYYFNWWGGNLRGVKDYPINLGKYQDKLVYSPHDYGPTVYKQPWFKSGYDYDSLMADCWRDNWLYIHTDNTAPLLIGEWGGFMTEPNLTWMTHMRTLISNYHLNHTFWCFNANSGDTGGLVLDDFTTWDEKKYSFVKEVLWQEGGKFVGLDHAIPLGENGISLSEAKGLS